MGLPAPARLQPLASARGRLRNFGNHLWQLLRQLVRYAFLGETPLATAIVWSATVFTATLFVGPQLFKLAPSAIRNGLQQNFHIVLLASTGAVGTLVFKGAQDRQETARAKREEQKDASDSLFKWLDKLSDPTVGRAAWRAVTDSADREPRLEAQVLALAQDAVTNWLYESSKRAVFTRPSQRTRGPEPESAQSPAQEAETLLAELSVSRPQTPFQVPDPEQSIRESEEWAARAVAAAAWDSANELLSKDPPHAGSEQQGLIFRLARSSADGSKLLPVLLPQNVMSLNPSSRAKWDLSSLRLKMEPTLIELGERCNESNVILPREIECVATVNVASSTLAWRDIQIDASTRICLLSTETQLRIGRIEIAENASLAVAFTSGSRLEIDYLNLKGTLHLVALCGHAKELGPKGIQRPRHPNGEAVSDVERATIVIAECEASGSGKISFKPRELNDIDRSWWDPPIDTAKWINCNVTVTLPEALETGDVIPTEGIRRAGDSKFLINGKSIDKGN